MSLIKNTFNDFRKIKSLSSCLKGKAELLCTIAGGLSPCSCGVACSSARRH